MAELRSLTERQFSAGRCSEADCQQAAPKPTFTQKSGQRAEVRGGWNSTRGHVAEQNSPNFS